MQTAFLVSVAAAAPLYLLHWFFCAQKDNGPRLAALLPLFLVILGAWQGYAFSALLAHDLSWFTVECRWFVGIVFFLVVCGALIIPFYRYAGEAPHDVDI